jgi:hypothetical protein|tara:strand:+ start:8066 stop:9097 length:1032 start_codon:yes stop_codon:yes gene_type:complete
MAFLDNSGDIILDAVLTDVGRKRMAQGDFSISKFAIGDDEIDYGLYNKDHPSGSAYYDLEILQTPVLEAFTQINANINYGLLSYPRQDLLYLPAIEMNQKSGTAMASVVKKHTNGVIYLANDTGTPLTSTQLSTDLGGDEAIMISGDRGTGKFILFETGINTPANSTPTPSSANQSNYILSVGLNDQNFTVSYDSRFIASVQGQSAQAEFANNTASAQVTARLVIGNLVDATPSTDTTTVANYVQATVNGGLNRVYFHANNSGNDSSTNFSAINGPRASFGTLGITINPDLSLDDYTVYGKVAQSQGASSQTYDYIDTVVYVQGNATQATLQLPIRIIRNAAS